MVPFCRNRHCTPLRLLRRATYERHQSTSAALSTDRQNCTASLPSFIDAKMPSLPPTPPADHRARPVHHRAIQQLSLRQVDFVLRIPQLGRAKVPLRGAMFTREGVPKAHCSFTVFAFYLSSTWDGSRWSSSYRHNSFHYFIVLITAFHVRPSIRRFYRAVMSLEY